MRKVAAGIVLVIAAVVADPAAHAETRARYSRAALDAELGDYEKLAVREALELQQTSIERNPEGKTVRRIRVVNLSVFSKRDSILQPLNHFHWTTVPSIIEREVLVRPGEVWDQTRIDETARNLEVPEYSSLVVVLPAKSDSPDLVDILVVTRDVWSLRTNSKFEVQNATIVRLKMFPAENNFLGRRKRVAMAFDLDLGAVSLGPFYTDPNISGSRLTFNGFYQAIFNRNSKNHEGTRSQAILEMPFYQLDRKWGGSVSFAHSNFIDRTFRDTDVILFPDPERPDADPNEERAPRQFRLRTQRVATEGIYSHGTRFKHRFAVGYYLDVRRPELLSDFAGSPELVALFNQEVLGRSERLAGPIARYRVFETKFTKYKNIISLDLVEDVRLGPEFIFELTPGLEVLGSEVDIFRFRGEVGWTFDIAEDGYVRIGGGGGARVDDGGISTASVSMNLFASLPTVRNVGRLVVGGQGTWLVENGDDQILVVGAQTGLRGFKVGEFAGETSLNVNAEFRTRPLRLGFLRIGGAAFWDAGHAAESPSDLSLHHDVGIGIRGLAPQDSPFINRFDWAIPVNGSSAGFPGRLSIAFGQFF